MTGTTNSVGWNNPQPVTEKVANDGNRPRRIECEHVMPHCLGLQMHRLGEQEWNVEFLLELVRAVGERMLSTSFSCWFNPNCLGPYVLMPVRS